MSSTFKSKVKLSSAGSQVLEQLIRNNIYLLNRNVRYEIRLQILSTFKSNLYYLLIEF